MTAEIAILNKSAVALAADSAITIGRPPDAKIYNTVNKIFELCETRPVGVMIYNRLDFMGIPFETIISKYRKGNNKRNLNTISEHKNDFLNFLSNEIPYSDEDEDENIVVIIYDSLSQVNSELDFAILKDVSNRGRYLKSKSNGLLKTIIKKRVSKLKSTPFSKGFTTIKIPDKYINIAISLIDDVFDVFLLSQESKELLKKYCGYIISKKKMSSYRTGIVIAGFGDEELCPSLSVCEIDGMISGKLKSVDLQYTDIGRCGPHAEIFGFAQDDMVQSFVNGVDPTFRKYVVNLIREVINENSKSLLKGLKIDDDKSKEIVSLLKNTFDEMGREYEARMDKYIDTEFTKQIKDMVRSMPKQELATLAESLIEITSLKRKVTRDRETVGGDVDVAIISKTEGFVWTKRKHYFSKDLNPRFFARHYGGFKGGTDEGR